MNMQPELLLPAGDLTCMKTAVKYGADAVYFGAEQFSARSRASNFSEQDIYTGIEYCHKHGVKAYCTVNTLLFNDEFDDAFHLIYQLADAKVDALIVQDLGLAHLIHEALPTMPLHGSTQMVVHNAAGAKALADLGFERVVLARECTLDEIRSIHDQVDIELEVFIHGALCISYSGACYMSSFLGGRSGNRGDCAQPCRMTYDLLNKQGDIVFSGYPLSTKDLNTLNRLGDLVKLGVSSLKIEGRMKKPEYIAATTQAYRQQLDALAKGKALNSKKLNYFQKNLVQVFNRSGFTTAHWDGKAYADLMSLQSPKNTGRLVGSYHGHNHHHLEIRLSDDVQVGDGYVLRSPDGETFIAGYIEKMMINGRPAAQGIAGDIIQLPIDRKISPQTKSLFYKTYDKTIATLTKLPPYQRQYSAKPLMHFYLYAEIGSPLIFQVNTSEKEELVTIPCSFVVTKAEKQKTDASKIQAQLERLGESAFEFGSLFFEAKEDVFLPASVLNRLRREAVAYYENDITVLPSKNDYMDNVYAVLDTIPPAQINIGPPKLSVSVSGVAAAEKLLSTPADEIIISITMQKGEHWPNQQRWAKLLHDAKEAGKNLALTTDNIISERHYSSHWERILQLADLGFTRFYTGNIGLFYDLSRHSLFPDLVADYTMNAINDVTLQALMRQGACEVILSPEMNYNDIATLSMIGNLPLGLTVAGAFSLMTSEYCAIGSLVANTRQGVPCPMPCCQNDYMLKNKEGQTFSLVTDEFCRMHILGDKIYSLHSMIHSLEKAELDRWRIEGRFLSVELIRDLLMVFRYHDLVSLEKIKDHSILFTDQYYKRGIRK